jgi:hypothetical protein
VLIADGFKELTDKKDGVPFTEKAKKWDIFDPDVVFNNFYKLEKQGGIIKPQRILSIEEIADEVMRLEPETAMFDCEAFEEMDHYLKSKGKGDQMTVKAEPEEQETHDPIMNLLHCF